MSNFDVVIIGAGPVGLTEACLLKSLNKNLNICVIEGRAVFKRSYGLAIAKDSIAHINAVIDEALTHPQKEHDIDQLKSFKKRLISWNKASSIRTNSLQMELIKLASDLGIAVFQSHGDDEPKDYNLTENRLNALFDPAAPQETLTPALCELRPRLADVKIIIGADGAHSVVRQTVMGPDKTHLEDIETYSYGIEVKYEIQTSPLADYDKIETSTAHVQLKTGSLEFGTFVTGRVGRARLERTERVEAPPLFSSPTRAGISSAQWISSARESLEYRPVTDFFIVGPEAYKTLVLNDDSGSPIKGVPGKSWQLKELQEKAQNDPTVNNYYQKIKSRIDRVIAAYSAVVKEGEIAIALVPLKIYRSREIVRPFHGKTVVLIGDASSGLVLERGFNKGLIEVAMSVKAIAQAAKQESGREETLRPYAEQAAKTFASERGWIRFKIGIIKIFHWPLQYILSPLYRFFILTPLRWIWSLFQSS